MQDLSAQQFSDLVGQIYDCALAPDCWPSAMQSICDALDCIAGQLYVVDITTNEFRFARTWNELPEATAVAGGRFKEVSGELNRQALRHRSKDPDEPLVLRRVPGIAATLAGC